MISAAGIGSGLDINGIVAQLMAAESRPLDILKTEESEYNTKLSAYGSLKSALANFQTAMKDLVGNSGFNARTATVSNANFFSATADSTAAAGAYTLQVNQLAQQQKLTSAGVADAGVALGTGSLVLKVGDGAEVTITPSDYSLQGIRDALNESGADITATIVNDGSANGNRLVITANDTGAANTIKITATDPSLSQFNYDPASPVIYDSAAPSAGMSQLQAAQDANLTIDGLPVTKSSNTITDAIQGLTLNLSQVTDGEAVTITVAHDASTLKTAVANFAKAYNDLQKTISTMTAYDPDTKVSGSLQGDSGAKSVLNQVRGVLTQSVDGAGSLSLLSDLGVSFQKDGTLAVDDTKLQKAIDNNFDDIATLFSSTSGYATVLSNLAEDMLGDNGLITSRTEGINTSIENNKIRQENMELRLEAIEKRYRTQFTALDAALASMQNTSAFLTQQLAALAQNTG